MELGRPFRVVTSTVDGDVLAVLAGADHEFTSAEMQRLIGARSVSGVRKAVARLVAQGVVVERRAGGVVAYRLNREHLAAAYLAGIAGLRQEFITRLTGLIAAWASPPVYAALFGSGARGDMSVTSDLDILLVMSDDVDRDCWDRQISDLTSTVHGWTGNDPRVLEFTHEEVASRGKREPVLYDVLEEGVTLAGTRFWLFKQLRGAATSADKTV